MMTAPITLAYSPCPNDTFIFAAWTNGLLTDAPPVEVILDDVEALNQAARAGRYTLTKASYGAVPALLPHYRMLRSGGALGRGCGPLVIARPGGARTLAELEPDAVIAVPGEMTTAFLLLQLALKRRPNIRVMRFDEIVTAVAAGTVAAGLIIHESRFTYMNAGLIALADLGEWWERTTGHPIPLGVILMQRTYHEIADTVIDDTIRRSLAYAYANPERIAPYIREHAFEMDEQVMRAHIALYVNEYSVDIGPAGEAAIRDLFGRAQQAGLLDETTPVEFSRPPAGLSQAGAPS